MMRRRMSSAAVPVHRQALPLIALDAALVTLAYYLSFKLRFDSGIPTYRQPLLENTIAWAPVLAVAVFTACGLYRHSLRQATAWDFVRVAQAIVIADLALVGFVAFAHPSVQRSGDGFVALSVPAGIIALYGLLMLLLVGGLRFAVAAFRERPLRRFRLDKGARRVLIIGAGEGGRLVLKEILRNPSLSYRPVGFLDDDRRKQGSRLDGVRVLGATKDLPRILEEIEPDEVLIAIPSAPGTLRGSIVSACRERGVPVRTLPTVFELLQGGIGKMVRQVRSVQVEDVLGREPVKMEIDKVGEYLSGRVVLVTGAGGSIGSELCRQIARVGPSRLVLLDHAEDNLFEIERELVEVRHALNVVPVLADCKEEERMREVFLEHRPAIVFHAAAYKHVAMMEANPVEAFRNNAIATRVMTRVAGEAATHCFVLVSTDKAVSPATVMGASKALAEWQVESADARFEHTAFASVRFGNVLGSSGSVVPIFRRQIAAGGPVTVTDPEMTRYFMTIPEAVQLIIQAGSLSSGGEVFVLEMGEPVRILDLARDMIRLSGLEPDKDIAIEIVGPRPGEKLHEDLFNAYEEPLPTAAPRILCARRPTLDPGHVEEIFDRVNLHVLRGEAAALAEIVAELARVRLGKPRAEITAAALEPTPEGPVGSRVPTA